MLATGAWSSVHVAHHRKSQNNPGSARQPAPRQLKLRCEYSVGPTAVWFRFDFAFSVTFLSTWRCAGICGAVWSVEPSPVDGLPGPGSGCEPAQWPMQSATIARYVASLSPVVHRNSVRRKWETLPMSWNPMKYMIEEGGAAVH
jgi:hypothetical protein